VGQWPWWLSFFLVLLVNYAVINIFGPTQTPRLEVSYTFFKQQVAAGNVSGISSRGDTIQGTFAGEVHYSPESEDGTLVRDFSTVRPAF
jgi:cell division protease FtsH